MAVEGERAFAASLFEHPPGHESRAGGPDPPLHELLADARWQETPRVAPCAPCTGTVRTAGGKHPRKGNTKGVGNGADLAKRDLVSA